MHPNLAERLTPILEAINVIQNALADKKFDDFRDDQVLRLASERGIGIVRETARLLPEDIRRNAPILIGRVWPPLTNICAIIITKSSRDGFGKLFSSICPA
jgi:uncharacterized protein with HEPN domain